MAIRKLVVYEDANNDIAIRSTFYHLSRNINWTAARCVSWLFHCLLKCVVINGFRSSHNRMHFDTFGAGGLNIITI